ncbi:hypothetical protein KDD30_01695 [Photobacterium sp. GJ3]|nr:hypothetical protein KDD30_01695 [Photobacterium sp. GJ3]
MDGYSKADAGVFLGAHAFTNVCDFYRRILADEALSQTQAWCKDQLSLRVSEVARALGEIHDHADLTASGLQFVSGLDALWLHASQSLPQPHAQVPALTER